SALAYIKTIMEFPESQTFFEDLRALVDEMSDNSIIYGQEVSTTLTSIPSESSILTAVSKCDDTGLTRTPTPITDLTSGFIRNQGIRMLGGLRNTRAVTRFRPSNGLISVAPQLGSQRMGAGSIFTQAVRVVTSRDVALRIEQVTNITNTSTEQSMAPRLSISTIDHASSNSLSIEMRATQVAPSSSPMPPNPSPVRVRASHGSFQISSRRQTESSGSPRTALPRTNRATPATTPSGTPSRGPARVRRSVASQTRTPTPSRSPTTSRVNRTTSGTQFRASPNQGMSARGPRAPRSTPGRTFGGMGGRSYGGY
ncbi:MAG TPA: hypothetical protein DCM40_07340, partial [Maribacter sp.]|nr:hypothetical protein [Maribacter sp.]